MRWLGRGFVFVLLTVLTQVGGLAYLVALATRRKLLVFVLAYAAVWGGVQIAAPLVGRVALPCFGEPLRMQSPLYCGLMRNFVTAELADVAQDVAQNMAEGYSGTVTLALDGSFPFFDGFPLLPHLSHDDGEKLDLAFYYQDEKGYLPAATRSPLGYFAFEALRDGAVDDTCPATWATMRWDLRWLQGIWADHDLDQTRTAALIRLLAADQRVAKIFVEPPLGQSMGLADPKLRFQGCRAARHDDHIHLQL
ncbi:penicillin-insensitive murein endopeptidase [Octadecabacter sp. B2R22]|nr:penicillin-insensitive murein endopeptidase [Octadecabacter sp. B2R22]MBU2991834.1 penicillin-insensitive murein endopeptidase [Octadecabacter sp. B2R22]